MSWDAPHTYTGDDTCTEACAADTCTSPGWVPEVSTLEVTTPDLRGIAFALIDGIRAALDGTPLPVRQPDATTGTDALPDPESEEPETTGHPNVAVQDLRAGAVYSRPEWTRSANDPTPHEPDTTPATTTLHLTITRPAHAPPLRLERPEVFSV